MVYSQEELYHYGERRSFPGEATEAAFLLGGIGTGNISLGSRGQLKDWEIFNKPGKGSPVINSYFTIWTKEVGKDPIAKVLESKLTGPYRATNGEQPYFASGLPRMQESRLKGEYPYAFVDFEDTRIPVEVSLKAFTPFVPLNVNDSSIPCAIFTYSVKNTSDLPVDVTIVGSLGNAVGGISFDEYSNIDCREAGQNINTLVTEDNFTGIYMKSKKYEENSPKYGNMSIVTTNKYITHKTNWYRGEWFDSIHDFWDDLVEDGRLDEIGYDTPSEDGKTDTGSIGAYETIASGEEKEFQFIISWYFPNRINGWNNKIRVRDKEREIAKNYYTTNFGSSLDVITYLLKNFDRLKEETSNFHQSLYSTSIPSYVIDAIANNLTVIRSNTCFHLDNGRFYGYEGSFTDAGCCPGNCTHVWNFAHSLAFLFPTLEQSMRKTEFLEEVEDDGKMNFRAFKGFDSVWYWQGQEGPPAADGQMGTIMRVYREWKFSGNNDFLRELYPSIKKALKYAFLRWDTDGDGVFDGEQHMGYDIEFYGPNPLTAIYMLGALRAMKEMALFLEEKEYAKQLDNVFEKAANRVEELLWNGEYYIQLLDNVNEHKYQHGLGCLSDQMVGQQMANVVGLGHLLHPERVKSAVYSVYKYNFRDDFSEHANCQRNYAANDDKGLLVCSWPNGGRPRFPFVYSDEVWSGIEYSVATNLISEGYIDEAFTIVKAVQDRYNGYSRNPWNEIECGNHYARPLASWGMLVALSGYKFDLVKGEISFDPAINKENFSTFWSTGNAWGTFSQKQNDNGEWDVELKVLYGDATGIKVKACGKEWIVPTTLIES